MTSKNETIKCIIVPRSLVEDQLSFHSNLKYLHKNYPCKNLSDPQCNIRESLKEIFQSGTRLIFKDHGEDATEN